MVTIEIDFDLLSLVLSNFKTISDILFFASFQVCNKIRDMAYKCTKFYGPLTLVCYEDKVTWLIGIDKYVKVEAPCDVCVNWKVLLPLTKWNLYELSYLDLRSVLKAQGWPDTPVTRHMRRVKLVYEYGQGQSTTSGNITAKSGKSMNFNFFGDLSSVVRTRQKMDLPDLNDVLGIADKLDNPSVEEAGYSDRLLQMTQGTTIITTQEAAGAVCAYRRFPKPFDTNAVQDKKSIPGPAVDRFYTIGNFDLTQETNGLMFRIPLPGALQSVGVFGQNVHFHQYWRGGFCIHVQCNATPFHQGAFVVAAIPECEINQFTSNPSTNFTLDNNLSLQQLTLFPHQIVNLRSNNSATIVMPYISPFPIDDPRIHNNFSVVAYVVEGLKFSPGATTTLPVTISVSPLVTEFHAIRHYNNEIQPQGVPVISLPGNEQFITTLNMEPIPTYPLFSPTNGFENPGRVKNLLEVARIPTFVNNFGFNVTVTNTTDSTTPIFVEKLSFMSRIFSGTYLGNLSRFFSMYRGSIVIDFIYTGSKMSTGKFLIAYTPPGNGVPKTRLQASEATSVVWDIGLQSCLTFTIPYFESTMFRLTNVSNDFTSTFGFLSFWYQTSIIVPPNAPNVCKILMLVRAGKDFVFRLPVSGVLYQGIETSGASQLVEGESGQISNVKPDYIEKFYPACIDETKLKYFFSRSFPIYNFTLTTIRQNMQARYGTWSKVIKMEFPFLAPDNTVRQNDLFVTLFKMFTYWRCTLEFTVVVTLMDTVNKDAANTMSQAGADHRYQVIYTPPFDNTLDVNASSSSKTWLGNLAPSIYGSVNSAPVRFKIPFVSYANAYSSSYDGQDVFTSQPQASGTGLLTPVYKRNPANYIGHLGVRMITGMPETGDTQAITSGSVYSVSVFVKMLKPRAYIPRPLIKNFPATNIRMFEDMGNRRRFRVKTKGVNKFPLDIEKVIYLSNFRITIVNGDSLSCFHLKDGIFVTPAHLDWYACEGKGVILQKVYVDGFGYPLYGHMKNLVVVEHKDLMFFKIEMCESFPFILPKTGKFMFSDISCYEPRVGIYNYVASCHTFPVSTHCNSWTSREAGRIIIQDAIFQDWEECVPCLGSDNKVRIKTGMIMTRCTSNFGDCGGLLYDDEKIYGMLTAGIDDITAFSAFTIRAYETMKVRNNRTVMLDYGQTISRSAGRYAAQCVESGIEGAFEQFNVTISGMMDNAIKTGQKILVKVLKYLSKIVGVCMDLYFSKDRFKTLMSLTLVLGPDFVEDPFCKLYSYLGCVTPQGPFNSLKTFVDLCNAGKALEWLVQKLGKFMDLIGVFSSPETEQFKKAISMFPQLRHHYDTLTDPEERYELCQLIVRLQDLSCKIPLPRHLNIRSFQEVCEKARNELKTGFSRARPEPVVIMLKGGPGVGKSVAATILAKALAANFGGGVYSLTPGCKHFDGYRQEPVMIMDDLCQNPTNEDAELFCQLVSTAPFRVPMADISEKGMLFTTKFIIVTTNHNKLAPVTITFPKAFARRIYLDMEVRVRAGFMKGEVMNYRKCFKSHPCTCLVNNFQDCKPILCGCGVFAYRKNASTSEKMEHEWSLDEIVTKALAQWRKRVSLKNVADEVTPLVVKAQGPDDGLCDDISTFVSGKSTQSMAKAIIKQTLCEETVTKLNSCPEGPEIMKILKQNEWHVDIIAQEQSMTSAWVNWMTMVSSALSILLSATTLIYLLYTIFSSMEGPYTGRQKTNEIPQPTPRKKVSVVKKEGPIRTGASVVKMTPDDQFAHKMFKKSVSNIRGNNGSFSCIGIYDNVVVVPTHFDCDDFVYLELQDGSEVKVEVLDIEDFSDPLHLLEIRKLELDLKNNKFPDIREFLSDGFCEEDDARLVINNENFQFIAPIGKVSYYGIINLEHSLRSRMLRYNYPTRSGQCGGAIVKAGKVLGMHIGGDGVHGYAALLKKSYFEPKVKTQGLKCNERKAPRSVNVRTTTSFQPSVFHDVFSGKKQPAALSKYDKRVLVDFDKALFNKYVGNIDICDEDKVRFKECIDFYIAKIKPLLPDNVTEPLSLDEVIDGIENLAGLDLNTSAGYPYNTMGVSKKKLLQNRDYLLEGLDLYGYGLPFTTYLKDELRPLSKIELGKTRVIEASSVNDTIRMKQVFGRFFQMMHKNPGVVTGSAVGCNPDYHWTLFAAELGDDNICAFDYTGWDASLSPFMFDMLKYFFIKLGYDKNIVNQIINHICNSVHIYKDEMYDVIGGMPSGCSGTSIFNSLINNWCVMYMVMDSYSNIDLDKLKILCYGDDLLVSYPYSLDPALLAESGKTLGLTMTPPDKASSFSGSVNLKDATFLKRRFLRDAAFPWLVHPVFDPSEIEESIRWTRNPAQTQEHIFSLCELKWHEGEDAYNDFLDKINTVPLSKGLTLFPYSYYRNKWLGLF
nr:MAG: polyprotein [Coypu sapelovirus 2]